MIPRPESAAHWFCWVADWAVKVQCQGQDIMEYAEMSFEEREFTPNLTLLVEGKWATLPVGQEKRYLQTANVEKRYCFSY